MKKRRQGETDYFVDILSPELGKITVIAKGALKITSKFLGKLEIGQKALFEIHRTQMDYLILKNCESMWNSHMNIKDLGTFVRMSKILELPKKIEFQPVLNEELFNLLSNTLLLSIDKNNHSPLVFLKLILLNLMGYLPNFKNCSNCQNSLEKQIAKYSDIGEIFCSNCAKDISDINGSLKYSHLKILNYLKIIKSHIEEAVRISVSENDLNTLEEYANNIYANNVNISLTTNSG